MRLLGNLAPLRPDLGPFREDADPRFLPLADLEPDLEPGLTPRFFTGIAGNFREVFFPGIPALPPLTPLLPLLTAARFFDREPGKPEDEPEDEPEDKPEDEPDFTPDDPVAFFCDLFLELFPEFRKIFLLRAETDCALPVRP